LGGASGGTTCSCAHLKGTMPGLVDPMSERARCNRVSCTCFFDRRMASLLGPPVNAPSEPSSSGRPWSPHPGRNPWPDGDRSDEYGRKRLRPSRMSTLLMREPAILEKNPPVVVCGTDILGVGTVISPALRNREAAGRRTRLHSHGYFELYPSQE